jgi:hypothetical protein
LAHLSGAIYRLHGGREPRQIHVPVQRDLQSGSAPRHEILHLRAGKRGVYSRILEANLGRKRRFETFAAEQCFVQSSLPNAYDTKPKTLPWVLDKAVVAVEQDGVDLLVIDPWNELERAKPRDMMLTDYIGECLMYLKQFCRSMNVAVILAAHPTKSGVEQGKTMTLADIEGSMNWYNKMDNGLIVVRAPQGNTSKVISAKARERGSGRRGECHFFVDPATGIFTPQPGAVSL